MPRVSSEYEEAQQRRILDGAARVFADNGYRQTTIDQIGAALQLSKGAIYLYFRSKEDLFVAALAAIYDRRFSLLSDACREQDPVSTKFEKILDRLGSFVDRDDYVYSRLSLEGFLESDHIPRLQAVKTDSYQRFYKLLHGLLQEGQRSGEIDLSVRIASVTTVLMALSDGLMMHSLVQGRGIDSSRVRLIVHETFSHLLGHQPKEMQRTQS